jgi:hypothetical protein
MNIRSAEPRQVGRHAHGNTFSSGFRHPEMLYLALANQILNGPGDILDRHTGIHAVLVKEVDDIGSQSFQRRIRVLANAFGPAVESFGRSAFLEPEFVAMTTLLRNGSRASPTSSSLT